MVIWHQFFTYVSIWYQFLTCVRISYWFFTFVNIEYQFFTGVRNWYQFFTSEKNRTSPLQMTRIRTNSSKLKMLKMWNLSTDVRPQKLSKLTIRKFHIFQKWGFGTNSPHDVKFAKCEICGSTFHIILFDFFRCYLLFLLGGWVVFFHRIVFYYILSLWDFLIMLTFFHLLIFCRKILSS